MTVSRDLSRRHRKRLLAPLLLTEELLSLDNVAGPTMSTGSLKCTSESREASFNAAAFPLFYIQPGFSIRCL